MTLRRLKWITIGAAVLFFVVLEVLQRTFAPAFFTSWPGYILTLGMVLLAALLFSEVVFGIIGRLQDALEQQNRELLALHEAGLDVAGELGLEAVLQKIVDAARELVGARYGALSVMREDGHLDALMTSGITTEERVRMGPLPRGHGLLGVVLTQHEHLRLRDLTKHPRSVGFPPDHPPMHSLLAVPILSRGGALGNLYLTEKTGAVEFSEEDEETLTRFATQAAIAIENARLHEQARELAIAEERGRIAREMHDSLAQVLAYVNTKAQAVQQLLQRGRSEDASAQVGQMATAAREAYADVREGILALRSSQTAERGLAQSLEEYLERWREQSGIPVELVIEPEASSVAQLSPAAEVQLLRIIQEALSNVRKHSRASRAKVELRRSSGKLDVAIQDNGEGFDPVSPTRGEFPHFGLYTMQERAEAVGGTLEISSELGKGTRVSARIPVQPATHVPVGK